jgi:regulator of protease activity HflC (stomatin/prohibitin superfamily)
VLRQAWQRIQNYLGEHGPEIAVFILLAVLLGITLAPLMVYTVPAGHVGVLWKRFSGTVLDRTLGSGIHIIAPWDRIYVYDLRIQITDHQFDVLTADGLEITVNISYRFWLNRNQVPLLHNTVGPSYADILLTAPIGARARDTFGRNTVEEIYSYRRGEVQAEILRDMQQRLQHTYAPQSGTSVEFLQLDGIFVRGITLPATVQEAIARKMQMQQRSLEYDYRLLLEAKESKRKQIEARGIKEFQDIVSQGITESYLRWRGIDATQALATSPNSKTVIIGSGRDGLPIILGGVGNGPLSAGPAEPPQLTRPPPAKPPLPLATEQSGSMDLQLPSPPELRTPDH